MKTITKILWSVIAALFVTGNAYAYDFKVDGLYYTIISSQKLTVELTKPASGTYSGSVVIPYSVEYNDKSYKVTKIGRDAFYNSNVTDVVIPESVQVIDKWAFGESTRLKTCVIPNSVIEIKESAFRSCSSLEKITLSSNLKTLSEYTFNSCSKLSEIIIPASVTNIEYSSAHDYGTLNGGIFSGCSNLRKVVFEDGDNTISFTDVWEGTSARNPLYAKSVFYECPIEYVYLGRNINNGPYSTSLFEGKNTLTEVEIGNSVKKMPNFAFANCTQLQHIGGYAFNHVNEIGDYAFQNCKSLTKIYLPQIVKLGRYAFDGNGALESVFIGDHLQTLSECCFSGQTALKNAYIGTGLVNIEEYAFRDCNNLTNVYLFSDKLVAIGVNAIPLTISKICVPNPPKYENILTDYYLDALAIINPISTTYSGRIPTFTYVNNVAETNLEINSYTIDAAVGKYNVPLSVTFSNNAWSSTISLMVHV